MTTIHYTYVTGRHDSNKSLEAISEKQAEAVFVETAKKLGYTPVKFSGWTADASRSEMRAESKRCYEVARSLSGTYSIHIHGFSKEVEEREESRRPLEEDAALAIARAATGDTNCDI